MLKFYINNTEIKTVQSVSFSSGMNQPVSSFSLSVSLRNDAWIGDMFSIADETGNVYFSGVLLEEVESLSIGGYSLTFTGKNIPGLLIRDDAYQVEHKNKSLGDTILEVLNTSNIYGYGVNLEVDESFKDSIISKFTPKYGESVLDSCARVASRFGLYTYYTYSDNTLHFKKIQDSGDSVKTYDFDSNNGIDASIAINRGIISSATDFIFNNQSRKVKDTTLVQSTNRESMSDTVVNGFSTIDAKKTIIAIDKSKYSDSYDSEEIFKNFGNRAYSTLCSTILAPPDNGIFRQAKYLSISSDSELDASEQVSKLIKDNMPSASITLSFMHIEVGKLNSVYRIKCKKLNIDGKFMLTSMSASISTSDIGTSTMTFTRLGYLK